MVMSTSKLPSSGCRLAAQVLAIQCDSTGSIRSRPCAAYINSIHGPFDMEHHVGLKSETTMHNKLVDSHSKSSRQFAKEFLEGQGDLLKL